MLTDHQTLAGYHVLTGYDALTPYHMFTGNQRKLVIIC